MAMGVGEQGYDRQRKEVLSLNHLLLRRGLRYFHFDHGFWLQCGARDVLPRHLSALFHRLLHLIDTFIHFLLLLDSLLKPLLWLFLRRSCLHNGRLEL